MMSVQMSICFTNAIDYRFEKRIYIPLPGPEARRRMFELNVGSTPCELGPKDYKALADRTEGSVTYCSIIAQSLIYTNCSYSGSDVAIVVRDAIMQPVRKVLSATHFKPTTVDGKTKWTPCSPGDPDAVEKTWTDVDGDDLQEPGLKLNDFIRAIESVRPTVTQDDIKRHIEWTNDSG